MSSHLALIEFDGLVTQLVQLAGNNRNFAYTIYCTALGARGIANCPDATEESAAIPPLIINATTDADLGRLERLLIAENDHLWPDGSAVRSDAEMLAKALMRVCIIAVMAWRSK